ncbi:uncharacterized protein LOC114516811 [Dendronephthya gigantea]|uniref:uncharacterized protein LOC114516811 n=1 Tax=Dendronephthya gigantea TaxID=151771 RepID=UPI00106B3D43|nr:uncharacterized protein LOC114516811 [Dendronephthya gigantea]
MKQNPTTDNTKDTESVKMNTLETKGEIDHNECGRTEYHGIGMAYIYIRGKLMFTMSEVARNLYPKWPRTTLNDRVRQMKIKWYTCTTNEIEKVLSVRGIVKFGVHCTLISKEDLDMFSSVYEVGSLAEKRLSFKRTLSSASSKVSKSKEKTLAGKGKTTSRSTTKAQSKTTSVLRNGSANSEQNPGNKANKGKARVVVKDSKLDNGETPKGHAVSGKQSQLNGKQSHVAKAAYECTDKKFNKVKTETTKVDGNPRKRRLSSISLKTEARGEWHEYIPTKRHRKTHDASSPLSDSLSYDSGVSSLQLDHDASTPRKPGHKPGHKLGRPATPKAKIQKQLKIKEVKRKYRSIKGKKAKTMPKQTNKVVGSKGKREIVKKGRKSKNDKEIKKRKIGCPNTITKDLIMKMDLKHMNDKDLINSFSPLSSPMDTNTTPSEDQPYLVKLMPVKPVWRVNSSFKFISNFQLPPSLVVQDGQLSPACSMICHPGKKPPSAHPIWKWKVGEPVISSKTVISYRIKKVKFT